MLHFEDVEEEEAQGDEEGCLRRLTQGRRKERDAPALVVLQCQRERERGRPPPQDESLGTRLAFIKSLHHTLG